MFQRNSIRGSLAIASAIFSLTILTHTACTGEEKHLFILSGQSNMAGLKPDESFTPAVQAAFGKENVIVVHDAVGGQPIRRWYKKWTSSDGKTPKGNGDLYARLMKKVDQAIKGQEIQSVTFIWMQGERDAKERHADVYADSLEGVLKQVKADLHREQLHCVVGRLSDFDMTNARYPDWTKLRDVQVAFAKSHKNVEWVDTDDLNDGLNRKGKKIMNDLHYSAQGYKTLGTRFAEKAILMIKGGDQTNE